MRIQALLLLFIANFFAASCMVQPKNRICNPKEEKCWEDPNSQNSPTPPITPNSVPQSENKSFIMDEDGTLEEQLTITDSDENDQVSVYIQSPPAYGELEFFSEGRFTYTPPRDFAGSVSFTYKLSDGKHISPLYTTIIAVNDTYDPPKAADLELETLEDTSLTYNINIEGGDQSSLIFEQISPAKNGQSFFEGKVFHYRPTRDFAGSDEITYIAKDNKGSSKVRKVQVTVKPINDPPYVESFSLGTPENTAIIVKLNARDIDSDVFHFFASMPENGSVSILGNTLTYTPNHGYFGEDSFTYRAFDGSLYSKEQVVQINIAKNNERPIIRDLALSTIEGKQVRTTLSATDGDSDPITFSITTPATLGSVTINDSTLTYTPYLGKYGTDQFEYKANDGKVDSLVKTITVSIKRYNTAPIIIDLTRETSSNTPYSTTLTASDEQGDSITFSVIDYPQNGNLNFNSQSGYFTYTPNKDYIGIDFFTYQASDGELLSDQRTFYFNITHQNKAPTTEHIRRRADKNQELWVTPYGKDADGDSLICTYITEPISGVLIRSGSSYKYRPDTDFVGVETLQFKCTDGVEDSNISTMTISIVDATIAGEIPVDDSAPYTFDGLLALFNQDLLHYTGTTHNVEVAIFFEDLGGKYLGYCAARSNGLYWVAIDQKYWLNLTNSERKLLIYHELGHCIIDRRHKDDKYNGYQLSLMNTYFIGGRYAMFEEGYNLELFTEDESLLKEQIDTHINSN